MTSSASLDKQVQHFLDVSKTEIRAAGEALLNARMDVFERLVERVSSARITQHITNRVTSCREDLDAFMAKLSNPAFWSFLKGSVLAGVGGGILSEAVAIAGFLGISILSAKVIGIVMILYGLSVVLPLVWERVGTALPSIAVD
ncbi:MAG: hypothetical protein ACXWZS_09745 [Gemmatirosa sp.]